MTTTELIALTGAMDRAFSRMTDADVDRLVKEQNADVRIARGEDQTDE